jgi:hypothetical protein
MRTTAHTAHTSEGIVGRDREWYRVHQGERGRGFEGGLHSPQILGCTGFSHHFHMEKHLWLR